MRRILKIVALNVIIISFLLVGFTWTNPLSLKQAGSNTEHIDNVNNINLNSQIQATADPSQDSPINQFPKSESAILILLGAGLIGGASLIRKANRFF